MPMTVPLMGDFTDIASRVDNPTFCVTGKSGPLHRTQSGDPSEIGLDYGHAGEDRVENVIMDALIDTQRRPGSLWQPQGEQLHLSQIVENPDRAAAHRSRPGNVLARHSLNSLFPS